MPKKKDKIHGSENARCYRAYIRENGINPRQAVTFADLIAMEDAYEKDGAPEAEADPKEKEDKK